jgi:pimeloyl-ACP methyl ester carboxylesterase
VTDVWEPRGPRRGTAVLLHGMMSLSGTWWRIGPALAARGWEVWALDLLAHGSSEPYQRPLSVEALATRVVQQAPDPVDLLVGHSLGAITAAAALSWHPQLAGAVVLEDPPGRRRGDARAFADDVERDARTVRRDRAALERRSAVDHPGWAAQDVHWDVEGIARAQAAAIADGLRAGLRRRNVAELIAGVRVPVLVLAGEPDRGGVLAEPDRSEVRDRLPAGRFVELPGGHCLHRDVPDRWLTTVTAFADEVLPGTRPPRPRHPDGAPPG